MPCTFNPTAFAARQKAKQDFDAHKQANPSPNSTPVLVERVKLLEKAMGI